jgi:hypothetical protein
LRRFLRISDPAAPQHAFAAKGRDQEKTIMKLRSISIAITLAGMTSIAVAGNPVRVMGPVNVTPQASFAGCTPAHPSQACADLRAAVLGHFTPFELGVIYGATTPRLVWIDTGEKARLQKRLATFLAQYQQQRAVANVSKPVATVSLTGK